MSTSLIDSAYVISISGLVLWQEIYNKVPDLIIDSLIENQFINQTSINNNVNDLLDNEYQFNNPERIITFSKNNYTIKSIIDDKLIYLIIFKNIIHLNFIEQFLFDFIKIFNTIIKNDYKKNLSLLSINNNNNNNIYLTDGLNFEKFTGLFKKRLSDLESNKNTNKINNNNNNNSDHINEKELKTEKKQENSSTTSIKDITNLPKKSSPKSKKKQKGKKARKWNELGEIDDDQDDYAKDYSNNNKNNEINIEENEKQVDSILKHGENWGSTNKTGDFVINDLSQELDDILTTNSNSNSSLKSTENNKKSSSSPLNFFRNIIGGKELTKKDLSKNLQLLESHLIKKNIAPEVSKLIVLNVEKNLIGSKTNNWTSIEKTVKFAINESLTKILTPSTSINLLHEINYKRKNQPNSPYVISIVGVNGVGKSTNLSKIAFWLLQNDLKVLITACDTFRSGAIEQLKVHVNNLSNLIKRTKKGKIDLFQLGYGGGDLVSKIALKSIKFAKDNNYDVILMDTAGRRHNDAHLMNPLENFAKIANPDKIIMVGEALVGTDSVLQAKNFNAAFGSRHLDFFLISKCDTVGDMIGSMVNMTYSTGIPILFVGTGQMYTDLRVLSVPWAVSKLMS